MRARGGQERERDDACANTHKQVRPPCRAQAPFLCIKVTCSAVSIAVSSCEWRRVPRGICSVVCLLGVMPAPQSNGTARSQTSHVSGWFLMISACHRSLLPPGRDYVGAHYCSKRKHRETTAFARSICLSRRAEAKGDRCRAPCRAQSCRSAIDRCAPWLTSRIAIRR